MVACGAALSVHLPGHSANAPQSLAPLRPPRPLFVGSGGAYAAPLTPLSVPSYRQHNGVPAGVLSPPGPSDWPFPERSPTQTSAQGLPYSSFSPFSAGHSLGSGPSHSPTQLAPLHTHSRPLAPAHLGSTTSTTTHLNLSPITIHNSPLELPSSCMPLVSISID